jgi:hypothetical protein
MKRLIALSVLFLSAAAAVSAARPADEAITVTGVTVERLGGNVNIGYTATIAPKAVKRGRALVFAPVVTNGGFRLQLPAVVVNGKGSKAAQARREYIFGAESGYKYAAATTNGQGITVSESIPFDGWMTGGRVTLESVYGGCCSHSHNNILLADHILPPPAEPKPMPKPAPPRISVGDSLAQIFAFVRPVGKPDATGGGLNIFFRVNRYDIDPDYMDNEQTLADLVGAIRAIRASSDSRVVKVVVGGFASPEGGSEINYRLGHERAKAVKSYLEANTGLRSDMIATHNGEVDWRSLRKMIEEGEMPEKQRLLDIIDTMPVWDSRRGVGRLGTIMRMNGGRTYRHLATEHFPYLRTGAFISVYYENQPNQSNKPNHLNTLKR